MYHDGGVITCRAGATINLWRVVTLWSTGLVKQCSLGGNPCGVAQRYASSGEVLPVALLTKTGTVICEAEITIPAGAVVYARASGRIGASGAGGARRLGIALEAATAAGDLIEVLMKT